MRLTYRYSEKSGCVVDGKIDYVLEKIILPTTSDK